VSKKINISGEIGFDYFTSTLSGDLKAAKGEDLEIDIASPGGDVFSGIEIYNMIRDYKRDNPKAQIMMTLKGLGASMASYIMMAPADLRAAEDNAVFMIHNPWSLAIGDYKEMEKQSEFLSGLASIMADAYVSVTGKSKQEIQTMMDAETWLFGDEIKDAGFVDEIVPGLDALDKSVDGKKKSLAAAALRFVEMKKNMQRKADAEADSKKIAAMLKSLPGKTGIEDTNTIPAGEGVPKKMEKYKTVAEFQTAQGDLYKEIADTAVASERARVKALTDLRVKAGKVGAIAELIDSALASGKTAEDISVNVASLALAAADSPDPLNTHKEVETPDGYVPIAIIR
jgi:ATP-dependent Clp protease, protease subunit